MQLTDEMLTEIGMPIMVTGLMLYTAFIIINLGAKSKARVNSVCWCCFGLAGMLGFFMKYIIKFFLAGSME